MLFQGGFFRKFCLYVWLVWVSMVCSQEQVMMACIQYMFKWLTRLMFTADHKILRSKTQLLAGYTKKIQDNNESGFFESSNMVEWWHYSSRHMHQQLILQWLVVMHYLLVSKFLDNLHSNFFAPMWQVCFLKIL